MLVLSASVQKQAMTMTEAIDAVAQALVASSSGQTVTPLRTNLPISDRGSALFMPSFVDALGGLGVKFVSVVPGNKDKGKETIQGVLVLADAETAEPLALLEASYLTALRTGAASGLATKYLAREDARTLAVIGTGVQSRSAIAAVQAVRGIREIRLYNRTSQKAVQLADQLRAIGGSTAEIIVVDSPAEAVSGADIVVTATNAINPVFSASALEHGVHINAIGSYRPDMQELPSDLFALRPKIVVESYGAALEETGDLLVPIQQGLLLPDRLHAELGEIVQGDKPGRENDSETTVFKSVGLAAMDIVVGKMLYERASELGLGEQVSL